MNEIKPSGFEKFFSSEWLHQLQGWDAMDIILGFIGFAITIFSVLESNRRTRRFIEKKQQENIEGNKAIQVVARIRRIADNDDIDIWDQNIDLNALSSKRSDSIPIVLLANLKGGVGKSTIAANLAASFACRGENVLAIDLDYQGSLSSLFLGHARATGESAAEAQEIVSRTLSGSANPDLVRLAAKTVGSDLQNLSYLAASYDLAAREVGLMLGWLSDATKSDLQPDIRLRLADALYDQQNQKKYDRIIIDTAPRITTAFINGFTAATHLFIPTILDEMSVSAVEDFLERSRKLRFKINPHLEVAGVIASMKHWKEPSAYSDREQPAVARLEAISRNYLNRDIIMRQAGIPRMAEIARHAGHRLVYFEDDTARNRFDALADEVARRAPSRKTVLKTESASS